MSILRIGGRVAAALLLGAAVVVSGTVAPAEAATARKLSLHPSTSLTGTNTPVTLSGTLTKSPVGATVRLQIKAGNDWLTAQTLKTTTAAGAYTAKVTMPPYKGKYYFRTIASAGGGLSSATSPTVGITVLTKVNAKMTASKKTVAAGGKVTFTGHVSPSVTSSKVALQRYNGASWASLTTATLSKSGTFSVSVRPKATTTYRLSVPRHGDLAPAYSASTKITVTGSTQTPPTITTTSLPDGAQGTPYNQTLTRTGGAGTWSKAGTLPPGLVLKTTGVIAGTPTDDGTFAFTARFTETSSGLVATKPLSITVASGPVITTASLPDGKRGDAYTKTLTKSGQPGTWSATGLPTGITLDSTSGVLSGTPTVSGDFTVTVTLFENTFKSAQKVFPLHIDASTPPHITTTSLPDGVTGKAYTKTLTRTGEAGTWAVTAGALPGGLTLSASTGQITGTPSDANDYVFTVTFTESAAQTSDSQELVLHVSVPNAPTITTDSPLPAGSVGSTYSLTLQADQLPTFFNPWALGQPFTMPLPPGLALDASTGKISGKPTQAGLYRFQIRFTSITTVPQTKLFTLRINP